MLNNPEYNLYLNKLEQRRDRVINGQINCIPSPFVRYSEFYSGVEHEQYVLCTASQKIGKSKLVDKLYVYNPLRYMVENPNKIKLKILYFTLEMSKEAKFYEFLSHLLYVLDGIVISPKDLKSTDSRYPCPPKILELLKSDRYQVLINLFSECVEYITEVRNPTGIYKYIKQYAEDHGHWTYKEGTTIDAYGKASIGQVKDVFIPDDPELYIIGIIDNFTNMTIESNKKKSENIETMSKYLIELRNNYKLTLVGVQHQAQSQEGNENIKLNRLEASVDGLGDCKVTSRDINLIIGLFNPFKYAIPNYKGYDITKLTKFCRFMHIIDDRDSSGGGEFCPLFFNGASSEFFELPRSNDAANMSLVYDYINVLKENRIYIPNETN